MNQAPKNEKPGGLAIAALITGIFGLSIVPIILGAMDLVRIRNGTSSSSGMVFDIVGIVLGVVGTMVLAVIAVAALVLLINLSAGGGLFTGI